MTSVLDEHGREKLREVPSQAEPKKTEAITKFPGLLD